MVCGCDVRGGCGVYGVRLRVSFVLCSIPVAFLSSCVLKSLQPDAKPEIVIPASLEERRDLRFGYQKCE